MAIADAAGVGDAAVKRDNSGEGARAEERVDDDALLEVPTLATAAAVSMFRTTMLSAVVLCDGGGLSDSMDCGSLWGLEKHH